ncbi:MAG: 4-(cytidine 5'-diphospho)-2-C-methyl-D-erythritol kinase [Pseudanabaenaceae cyanobacterium]
MSPLQVKVAAKINPILHIVAERPDGYHDLSLVFQSISLWDSITLTPSAETRLLCDHPALPTDRSNLALQAAYLLQTKFPDRGGVTIELHKEIPIGAGLAGGSADGAGVLVGLNLLWQLGLSVAELQELALELGSDVPFCITGGTAWGRGRGEILTPLPSPDWWVLVCKQRDLSVATGWAYRTYKAGRFIEQPKTLAIESILYSWQTNPRLMTNDLEQAVLPHYPPIRELKTALQELGAAGVLMSGSGAAVFAVVPTEAAGREMERQITDRFPRLDTWLTHTLPAGVLVNNREK